MCTELKLNQAQYGSKYVNILMLCGTQINDPQTMSPLRGIHSIFPNV